MKASPDLLQRLEEIVKIWEEASSLPDTTDQFERFIRGTAALMRVHKELFELLTELKSSQE